MKVQPAIGVRINLGALNAIGLGIQSSFSIKKPKHFHAFVLKKQISIYLNSGNMIFVMINPIRVSFIQITTMIN
jgi:hypothetical protein